MRWGVTEPATGEDWVGGPQGAPVSAEYWAYYLLYQPGAGVFGEGRDQGTMRGEALFPRKDSGPGLMKVVPPGHALGEAWWTIIRHPWGVRTKALVARTVKLLARPCTTLVMSSRQVTQPQSPWTTVFT